jgi:23S rRNA (cytosine1962-C5)-methyltransferase
MRVLNLFSYTGSFSVYAAAGGASSVTSVDLSNTYLAWAKENFLLNAQPENVHSVIRSDTFRFLDEACANGSLWDLIVVDPPTFSNSTKTARDLDINRDWSLLIRACEHVLAKEGTILFSTNSRNLKWDNELVHLPVREISDLTIPQDFRNRRIHRCWLLGNYTSSFGDIV